MAARRATVRRGVNNMPLAFLALAWLAVMTGINGNYSDVSAAFKQDVTGGTAGQGGFIAFAAGIIGIAVFFRLIGLPNAGKVFLFLVILVFVIENNSQLLPALEAIGGGGTASASPAATTGAAGTTATGAGAPATTGTGSTT